MNNKKIIVVIAVVFIVLAGISVVYVLTQDDDSGGYYAVTVNTTGDGLVEVGDGTTVYGEISNGTINVPKSAKDIIISGIGVTDYFEKFTIDGVENYADRTASKISDNMTVEVSFVPEIPADRNIVTVTTDGKGTVEVSGGTQGDHTYYGRTGDGKISLPGTLTDVKITGVPKNGYRFDMLTIDGEVSESNPATYAISKDMTISASFKDMYVTDARGRVVTIPEDIDSMLAVQACSLQLVSFFDAVNKVTHLDGSSNGEKLNDPDRTHSFIMKSLIEGLPTVDWNDPEQVIMAAPDIIISSSASVSELDNYQKKVGIPVFAINADVEFDSEIMYSQILSLGQLFGEEERARDIVDGIRSMIGNIQDNAGSVDETAYVCGMMFYGAGNLLKTSGNYLPFVYSNVTNVYPPVSGGQPYNTDIETLISKNPGMIFIDGTSVNGVIQSIKTNMGVLSGVDAISNGKIYKTMVYKNWGTSWVNQLINVYYIAEVTHPGEFGNFEDNANNIIQLFYPGTGVTYADLSAAQTGGGCGSVSL